MREKISALPHRIIMIDWTEKSYANIYNSFDIDTLVARSKKPQQKKDDKKDRDTEDETDSDDEYSDIFTKESDNGDEKKSDTYDESKARKRRHMKLSFQAVISEWNYLLHHALVPKG